MTDVDFMIAALVTCAIGAPAALLAVFGAVALGVI